MYRTGYAGATFDRVGRSHVTTVFNNRKEARGTTERRVDETEFLNSVMASLSISRVRHKSTKMEI
jgi:hypothetical protein